MRLEHLSYIGIHAYSILLALINALRAFKHHCYMRLEHLGAIGICGKNIIILTICIFTTNMHKKICQFYYLH